MRGLVWLVLLAGCADLPAISARECGNRVLDGDEDCDTFVDGALGKHLSCSADSPRACRYVCDDGALCPTGWACGLDAVCRPHAGQFLAATPVRVPTGSLELADFDGDRLLDLLGVDMRSLALAHGTGAGGFGAPQVSQANFHESAPAVGDVDGDTRADLLLREQGALILRLGGPGSDLDPRIYPRETLTAEQLAVAVVTRPNGKGALVRVVSDAAGTRLLVDGEPDVEVGAARLVGEPVVAELDPGTAGQELALALGAQIVVLHFDVSGHLVPYATVEVGAAVEEGVLAAEVDGDGHLDLLVAVASADGKLRLARADGTGGFHAAAVDPRLAVLNAGPGGPPPQPRLPYAAGRLGRDEKRDALVSTRGVFVWQDDALVRFDTLGMFSIADAAIADFDRDGLGDVVLARAGPHELRQYIGSDEPGFPTIVTPLTRPAVRLLATDLDADRAPDLTFVSEGLLPRLEVMYGNRQGPLDPPRSLGLTDAVGGVAAGPLGGGPGNDLVVLWQPAGFADDQHVLSTLVDAGDGRSYSSLLITDASGAPISTTSFRFAEVIGDDGVLDLAVLWGNELFVVQGRGDGTFLADRVVGIDLRALFPGPAEDKCVRLVTDLVEGMPEGLLLTGVTLDTCVQPNEPLGPVQLARIEPGVADLVPRVFELEASVVGPVLAAQVVDFFADGKLSLVAHVAASEREGEPPLADPLLVFDLAGESPLIGVQVTDGVAAFAALHLERRPGLDLLVARDDGVFVAGNLGDRFQVEPQPIAMPTAVRFRTGELNGDGLVDLVAVEPGSGFVVPYLSQPQLLAGPAGR